MLIGQLDEVRDDSGKPLRILIHQAVACPFELNQPGDVYPFGLFLPKLIKFLQLYLPHRFPQIAPQHFHTCRAAGLTCQKKGDPSRARHNGNCQR
jgi:hypothetical protein